VEGGVAVVGASASVDCVRVTDAHLHRTSAEHQQLSTTDRQERLPRTEPLRASLSFIYASHNYPQCSSLADPRGGGGGHMGS